MAFEYDYQSAVRGAKSALADQGLLSSTAGAGTLGQMALAQNQKNAEWNAARQQQDWAQKLQQKQLEDSRQQQAWAQSYQQNQLAAQTWQNLLNYGLGKASVTGQNKYAKYYSPYKFTTSTAAYVPYKPGPTGDPVRDRDGGVSDATGYTDSSQQWRAGNALQKQQLAQSAAQFQAELAQRQKEFSAQQAEAAKAADPWKQVWDVAFQAKNTDYDPDTAGFQVNPNLGSDIEKLSTAFGIDLIAESEMGNAKAKALLDYLYGNRDKWQSRARGVSADSMGGFGSAHAPYVPGAPAPAQSPIRQYLAQPHQVQEPGLGGLSAWAGNRIPDAPSQTAPGLAGLLGWVSGKFR